LKAGTIRGGLDVFAQEPATKQSFSLDNFIATPHGVHIEAMRDRDDLCGDIVCMLEGTTQVMVNAEVLK
jgi:phosphoglycerate dehydrogenase-like enzyme